MAHITNTRQELRRHLAALLFSANDYKFTTATAGGNTSVTAGNLAGRFASGSFVNGEVLIRSGYDTCEIRAITDYDGTTGEITVAYAWDTNPVATDEIEIYGPNVGIEQLHAVLNDAIASTQFDMPLAAVSELFVLGSEDRYIDIPTGWVSLTGVYCDEYHVYGDRSPSHISSVYRTEKTLAATTTRRSQALLPVSEYPIAGVAFKLRRVDASDALTGSIGAALYADSSGSPTGSALVSGTKSVTSLPTTRGYVYVPFTDPYYHEGNERIHVAASASGVTGLSASQYVALCGESFGSPHGVSGLSTDGGATWTTDADVRLQIRLVPAAQNQEFVKVPWREWRIVKDTTRKVQVLRIPEEGQVYRLEGQKHQALLDAETDTCALPMNFVVAFAGASYLSAQGSHLSDAERRAQEYRARAERWLSLNGPIVKQRLVEWY